MLLIGYLLLALVVAAVLFYLVVALLPSGLTTTPIRDKRPLELPVNRRMRLSDLDRIRIPVSLRGYRFAETDELIDRLAAEIQVRDEEIERLKRRDAPLAGEQESPDGGPGTADWPNDEAPEPEWAVRELGDQAAAELVQESAPAERAREPAVDQGDPAEAASGRAKSSEPAEDQR